MLVTKTPLRISFFGGGSDIPAFYDNHEGLVVSTAINTNIYLAINKCFPNHLKIIWSKIELVSDVEQIKHNIVRECLKYFELTSHMEICSFSDITSEGTGLGSSSTFTVGLINGLHALKSTKLLSPKEMAELACFVEIHLCKQPIGKQDQYAAAYGGFNAIYFNKTDIEVRPIQADPSTLHELNNNLYMFNTGRTRKTSSILKDQISNIKTSNASDITKTIVDLAKDSIKLLENRKVDDFGKLLDETWQIKKTLAPNISNPDIDEMYNLAMKNGGLGGKILGAGGGGYLLVYCPDKKKTDLLTAMENYERLPIKFTNQGSTVEMRS